MKRKEIGPWTVTPEILVQKLYSLGRKERGWGVKPKRPMILPPLIHPFISQGSTETLLVPGTTREFENTHNGQTWIRFLPLLRVYGTGSPEADSDRA